MPQTASISPKAEATRARLIDAMLSLIQRNGFRGAGLASVLEAAGVPKGSLYFHFPGGKDELAAAALRRAAAEYETLVREAYEAGGEFWTATHSIVGSLGELMERGDFAVGCPVSAVALDAGVESESLRRLCSQIYDGWIALVAGYLERDGRGNAPMLASAIVGLVEGALVMTRARRDIAPLGDAGRVIELLLGSPGVTVGRAATPAGAQ